MYIVLTLQFLQHCHLHLQHLFGLLSRFHLQSHVLLRQQIQSLVDLSEPSTTNLLQLHNTQQAVTQYSLLICVHTQQLGANCFTPALN